MADERIVYGARCCWWDSIDKAHRANAPGGIGVPSCPHCGSVLFELPDEATWWAGVDRHEANGHPGYRALVEWSRGKCFPHWKEAEAAYRRERAN